MKYVKELQFLDVTGETYLISRKGDEKAIATCKGKSNASKVVRALNQLEKNKSKA